MDLLKHNREAWDKMVSDKKRWTVPADSAAIEEVRTQSDGPFVLISAI